MKRDSLKVKIEEVASENAITKEENRNNNPSNLLFKKTTKYKTKKKYY